MSIMFNQICINENMLPKYTYFKLHDPAAYIYNVLLNVTKNKNLFLLRCLVGVKEVENVDKVCIKKLYSST